MHIDLHIWYLLSFLIFIILVFKPLRAVIGAALAKKKQTITQSLQEAEALKKEAEKLFQEAELKKVQAEMQAVEILNHAQSEISKAQEEMENSIREYRSRQNQLLQKRFDEMKTASIKDLENHLIDMSIENAQKLISKTLTKAKQREFTINELQSLK